MSTKEAPQRHRDADDEALLMGARETVMAFESVAWWLLLCADRGVYDARPCRMPHAAIGYAAFRIGAMI
jgi:hypothetical protein